MNAVTEAISPETQRLSKRYKNAYLVARIITIAGVVINLLGGVAIFALPVMQEAHGIMRAMDKGFAEVLFVFGYMWGFMLVVAGVLVTAQGRILRANLDSAVNSSPFLTNDIRAELLSLR